MRSLVVRFGSSISYRHIISHILLMWLLLCDTVFVCLKLTTISKNVESGKCDTAKHANARGKSQAWIYLCRYVGNVKEHLNEFTSFLTYTQPSDFTLFTNIYFKLLAEIPPKRLYTTNVNTAFLGICIVDVEYCWANKHFLLNLFLCLQKLWYYFVLPGDTITTLQYLLV